MTRASQIPVVSGAEPSNLKFSALNFCGFCQADGSCWRKIHRAPQAVMAIRKTRGLSEVARASRVEVLRVTHSGVAACQCPCHRTEAA